VTWFAAARPRTLPAAVVPVVVGTACAHVMATAHAATGTGTRVAWAPALAALAGALAIQVGTNFANDVFDAERGADGPDRIGPVRAVAAGLISAAAMKRAMIAAFAVAGAFGAYLATVGGWPIVAIGLASIAAGIAYTGGPWPLGYHGLGDVFVFAFFGPVAVCGTTYVAAGSVPALAIWAALPIGALATAILVVNNARDIATDTRAGKRTLAVRLGRRGAVIEYAVLLVAAYAVAGVLAWSHPWCLLPLATLPLAIVRTRGLARAVTGPEHNALLAATAQLLLAYGALLAVGLVL
jgi:1,4-dihydroxy-2-naphthoate octaprenyltransferase